ncbi:hypothetical protein GKE82_24835 [Conexibacter sp. W3-3-2]|uniref:hypothetical protein n=2 Tax=Conexibacter sp. W3-3-2 TaxID=2675227 RepID=UPI0012B6FDE0|nr:hypothetical protein [Conexibacter sp. W3-3-2]MTD47433.1 hypothetical protein [Conexibacter sp. W3-3-2]
MSLTTHLGTERRVWDTALLGIAYWEAQRTAPSVVHTPLLTKPRATAWTAAVKDAHDALRCTDTGLLSDNQIQWLVARTNDGQDLDELHGCLWGLDHANADAFITCWRDRHDEEVLLTPGDMIPVPEVMWPALADQPLVSRTTSINQPADGELPHARRYQPITLGDRQLEIVIDFEFEAELQEVLLPGFTAAAVHPYRDLADFANATGTANFPIRPRRHKPAVTHVTDALDTGATVVIVPELHVNAQALEKLAEIMAGHDSGPCLLIAGSRHEKIGKRKLNIATGLLAGVDEPLLHTKLSRAISPYTAAGPAFELIDQPEPLRLRLWQAGSIRMAIVICKDVLDGRIADHLVYLGVNVLLGPAMSGRTDGFRGHAETMVTDAQCVSVIVNGPLHWQAATPAPSSLITRPVAGSQRTDHHRTEPGIDLLHLNPEK